MADSTARQNQVIVDAAIGLIARVRQARLARLTEQRRIITLRLKEVHVVEERTNEEPEEGLNDLSSEIDHRPVETERNHVEEALLKARLALQRREDRMAMQHIVIALRLLHDEQAIEGGDLCVCGRRGYRVVVYGKAHVRCPDCAELILLRVNRAEATEMQVYERAQRAERERRDGERRDGREGSARRDEPQREVGSA